MGIRDWALGMTLKKLTLLNAEGNETSESTVDSCFGVHFVVAVNTISCGSAEMPVTNGMGLR
jgi:hypothetical protein